MCMDCLATSYLSQCQFRIHCSIINTAWCERNGEHIGTWQTNTTGINIYISFHHIQGKFTVKNKRQGKIKLYICTIYTCQAATLAEKTSSYASTTPSFKLCYYYSDPSFIQRHVISVRGSKFLKYYYQSLWMLKRALTIEYQFPRHLYSVTISGN